MSKVYHTIEELKTGAEGRPLVATLGLFDGVHLGHQHLIEACKDMAQSLGADSLVITMDSHPLATLRPELPIPRTLTSLRQKIVHLQHTGVDHIIVLPFTEELASHSATSFIAPFVSLGLRGMMLGYDNRFGRHDKAESLQDFDRSLATLGLEIHRVAPYLIEGEVVSSSRIRDLIGAMDFPSAQRLLGRPYSIVGRVGSGRKIGRTINFPTANIIPNDNQVTLPEVGVYISEVRLGTDLYPSMSYYGSTPTITPGGEVRQRIEAYLFGFRGDLYDQELEVGFRKYLRPDIRFEGLHQLKQQLERDAAASLMFFQDQPLTLKIPPEI